MNEEKRRKTYLVFSVVALAALIFGAAIISSSNSVDTTSDGSDAETTQDVTDNTDTNDGKSISDGDGETKDDANDETK